jgi:hypothetical protein
VFHVFRLTPEGTLAPVPPAELATGTPAKKADAIRKLDEIVGDGSAYSPAKPDEVTVTMTYPTFDAAGAHWLAQYTMPATWAASDGSWGGYERSTTIDIGVFPPSIQSAVVAPPGLRAYAVMHPGERIRGFTIRSPEEGAP